MDLSSIDSVFPVVSSKKHIKLFGTGFVIHRDGKFVYLLTCRHVVEELGGIGNVRIKGNKVTLVNSCASTDLAVLKVAKLNYKNKLMLKRSNPLLASLNEFKDVTANVAKENKLSLNNKFELVTSQIKMVIDDSETDFDEVNGVNITRWKISGPDLWPGCSGAPVLCKNNEVIGVIYARYDGGGGGKFIYIDALKAIWPEMQHLVTEHTTSSFMHTHRTLARLENRIESASTTIDVSGFTLNSMLKQSRLLKKSIIDTKLDIRFLAMDPDGNAIEQICDRYKSEICIKYKDQICKQFINGICAGDFNDDCNIKKEELKLGMSILIKERLLDLSEKLTLYGISKQTLRSLKEKSLEEIKLSKIQVQSSKYNGFLTKSDLIKIIGEHYWDKYKSDFAELTVNIRVIDQRLPTGCFIVDREKEYGVMHAEIEMSNLNSTPDSIHKNPLIVLHKIPDDTWFNIFVKDFNSLWEEAIPFKFNTMKTC